MALIADTETDGLLDDLTRIHILCLKDTRTGFKQRYRRNDVEDTIADGLRLMMHHASDGDIIVGHNLIKYDVAAIKKVYPWFDIPAGSVLDTLVLARAIFPDIKIVDGRLVAKGKLPKGMFKKHSLEAWGHRLGVHKGDYEGDPSIVDEKDRKARKWERWNPTMEDYCAQDIEVTETLLNKLLTGPTGRPWFEPQEVEAIRLEHDVAWIVARQERYGFLFDTAAAVELLKTLTKREIELKAELRKVFPPFYLREGELIPKADNKRLGYCIGAAVTKVKLTDFNPGSRDHIALMLKRRYGWQPVEFTNDGKAQIDETILAGLSYPEAKLLSDYLTVGKRIGQLSTGKEAWLKKVQKDGRIHGAVITNGAVTGRMTHAYPNVTQVPAIRSPFGLECRALFVAALGRILVGADADALELRCLAHFMARYDGGAYIRVVLEGKKEEGTDIHSVNARALGLDPKALVLGLQSGRDLAKTWFYAFIYGAGDEKLGLILTGKKGTAAKKRGTQSRFDFMRNLPALGKLVTAVRNAVADKGCLRGLDGRYLSVRSQHAALNTLLQSAGAVIMKRALVILDRALQALGLRPGVDYEFVANVHDEWQIETLPIHGDIIGKLAAEAIAKAGAHYNFRCPLAGNYSTGRTWADTH